MRTIEGVDASTAALLGAAAAAAAIGLAWLWWQVSQRQLGAGDPVPEPAVPPGVARVLSVLRSSALVVDADDHVLKASAPAYVLGLVRESALAVPDLVDMVQSVRRDGQIREEEMPVQRPNGGPTRHVLARVAPLDSHLVLVLAEDRTRERQLEAIRRDFVANVSHELKTPVGAISLLADTVGEAADDPEAVRHFATRMQTEGERLTRLVQQIIELSHVQGDNPLEDTTVVAVDDVVSQAIDRIRVDVEDKATAVSVGGQRGLTLRGDPNQLVVALGNLVENAVKHTAPGTTVEVDVRRRERGVDIAVTDRGNGIPEAELDRIFERFYRTDPARARNTGGTGLGLSIVKHVAAIHDGTVTASSVEGTGSTFTLSLPTVPHAAADVGHSVRDAEEVS